MELKAQEAGTAVRSERTQESDAQRNGTAFLLRSRDGDGWWRDFETYGGVSDEWVTAYAACSLAGGADSAARASAGRAFDLLCARRPAKECWAYNDRSPPDSDSTIWVCRLARVLNRYPEVAPAVRFLERSLLPEGGLGTYASDEAIRRLMRIPHNVSYRGWLAPHACVTAAAAGLPEFGRMPDVRAYLRREQQRDGHWEGYWWPDPEYTTALAVEALREHGTAEDTPSIEKAVHWVQSQPVRPSAFALACRIRILRLHDARTCIELAAALAELQNSDGSWPSSARIRIPPTDFVNPASIWNWDYNRKDIYGVCLDHARVFTTSTVVSALQLLR